MLPVEKGHGEALLQRKSSSLIPGNSGHGQDEKGQGEQDGIELDAPGGVIQNKPDERGYRNGKPKAQSQALNTIEAFFPGKESRNQRISGEENNKRQPQDNAQPGRGETSDYEN